MTARAARENPTRLVDVAARAGVSTATVARVIHGNARVRPRTREAVQVALDETGYRLNALAQGLKTRRTRTIGHLLENIFPNPFNVEVALGLEAAAKQAGYRVLLYDAHGDPELERQGVEVFIEWRVDAIVFTPPVDVSNVDVAIASGARVVQVERPTHDRTSTVVADNVVGATEAVDHLVALGHRRIGFIGAQPSGAPGRAANVTVERERLAGYRESLQRHGLQAREEDVVVGLYASLQDPLGLANGYEYAARIFSGPGRPTAVLVASDLLAAGVLHWFYDHRLRVPADVSVIGFDDTLAATLSPPLTTVRLPMLEFGAQAVELAIDDSATEPQHRRLDTSLVVRHSTGPVPTSKESRSC
jgi:DNA-binding LacI/PurR family transcriptional regulator